MPTKQHIGQSQLFGGQERTPVDGVCKTGESSPTKRSLIELWMLRKTMQSNTGNNVKADRQLTARLRSQFLKTLWDS